VCGLRQVRALRARAPKSSGRHLAVASAQGHASEARAPRTRAPDVLGGTRAQLAHQGHASEARARGATWRWRAHRGTRAKLAHQGALQGLWEVLVLESVGVSIRRHLILVFDVGASSVTRHLNECVA
jgi:hypothetical protein